MSVLTNQLRIAGGFLDGKDCHTMGEACREAVVRIHELESALREIARFCNVPTDSSAWSVFMMVTEDLRGSGMETFDVTKEPSIAMKNEMREIMGLEPLPDPPKTGDVK